MTQLRLTPKQKQFVLDAIEALIKSYAADRSCLTCDYFQTDGGVRPPGFCVRHGGDIPDNFVEQGCDDWQDDGAPF